MVHAVSFQACCVHATACVCGQVASLVYVIASHAHASAAWNGWNLRALMVRSPKAFATAYAFRYH